MTARFLVLSIKYLVLSFFFLLLITFYLSPPAHAQANTAPTPLTSSNYNDEIHPQRVIRNLISTGFCALAGSSILTSCYADQLESKKNPDGSSTLQVTPVAYQGQPGSGGAIGMVSGLMVAMYQQPPTSSTEYIASLGRNLGIAPKEAYANHAGALAVGGSGEGIIHPILQLWQVVRNIAYLGFIIVFIVVGFMIMFRTRINPQTVASAQQALPGLVLGIVLVTFSYFIAALMVDMAFLGTKLVAEIFLQSGLNNIYNARDAASNSNVFQLFGIASWDRFVNFGDTFQGVNNTLYSAQPGVFRLIPAIVGAIIGGILGVILGPWGVGAGILFGGAAGGAAGGVAGNEIIATIAALIIPLILLIALIIQFFKLLFSLISSYIQILVFTIVGPLFIMFSAIPGRGGILSTWFKTVVANALVFPAVFAMFMFAGVILGSPGALWQNTALPLFGGLSIELLRLIVAYGVLLGMPVVPEIVRAAFGVKGPEQFAQAAAGGFIFGAGRLGGAVQAGYQGGLQRAGVTQYREALLRQRVERLQTGAEVANPLFRSRLGRFIFGLPRGSGDTRR